MRPQMGVFIIRGESDNQAYVEAAKDLKGVMNGAVARLNGGGHRNRALQDAWARQGANKFIIEVLEGMEYQSEDPAYDYGEDLQLLKMMWQEKLAAEGWKLL